MPRIPTLDRATPPTVHPVAADTGGKAFAHLGQTLDTLGQHMEEARKSRETNQTVTEATRRIMENEDQLKTQPDQFQTWVGDHNQFMVDTRKQLESDIHDPDVLNAVKMQLNTIQMHSEVRMRQAARSEEINAGRAAIDNMESVLGDNYAQMSSKVDRQQIIDSVDEAITTAVDDGLLSQEEGAQRKRKFVENAEQLRARADISVSPELAAKMLKAGAYDVNAGDAQVLKEHADREIAADLAAKKAQVAQHQQETWTTIFDGIDSGKMGRADIDKAYKTIDQSTGMKGLSEQGARALIRFLDERTKKQKKESDLRDIYQNSIASGLPLDQKTKEHRDAAELALMDLAPKLPPLNPIDTNSILINNILRPLKVWPESLKRQMRIASKSGDMNLIGNFADLYGRVSSDPSVSATNVSMTPQDKAFWSQVVQMNRAGTMTPDSIAVIRHNTYDLTPEDVAGLKARYKEKKYAKGNMNTFTNSVLGNFEPSFIDKMSKFPDVQWSKLFEDAPPAPPGMVADYQNMVWQYYQMTSDIDQARNLASEDIKHAWTIVDDSKDK